MHYTEILQSLAILKKFQVFSKNPSIFFKKTQVLEVLRYLTISVAFYGNFAIIWRQKTFRVGQKRLTSGTLTMDNIIWKVNARERSI